MHAQGGVRPSANNLLRDARLRLPSPAGSGRPMSRQELAEEVRAHLFRATNREHGVDANYIGKLERGEHRWPNVHYRKAFRAVLGAPTDAALGFFVIRGNRVRPPARPDLAGPVGPDRLGSPPSTSGPRADPVLGGWPGHWAGRGVAPNVDPMHPAFTDDARHCVQLIRLLSPSDADPSVIDQVTADVRRLARSYGSRPLPELFAEVRRLRRQVVGLIIRSRDPRRLRDLHLLGSRLLGLCAHVALDRGEYAIADLYARTAWHCADLAEHAGMRAWVRASQSVAALRSGRLDDAVTALRQAAALRCGAGGIDDVGGVFADVASAGAPG